MHNSFNGQINISRDLRQNKQTVIGRYDLTDIVFLSLGIGIAIVVAYILGFSPIKVVDEFTAIIISIAPMVFIISYGFKRVAGMRKIDYVRMKAIDKKSKYRVNRKIDKSLIGEKHLVGFEIERKYVNKYIRKFLSYENLAVLSVRYLKDIKTKKNKIYVMIDLRYKKDDSIFYDVFTKFPTNNEIRALPVDEIYELEAELKAYDKHKVYMLTIYNINNYKRFVSKVKRYASIIYYFKKENKKRYVNTLLVIEDEVKKGKKLTKIEKVENLSNELGIILDKLVREQKAGKAAMSYLLTNPFNAYRVYK